MSFAVVLVGGEVPASKLLRGAEHAQSVIAADGGVRIARSHGMPIHVVIGDLDSASAGDVAWAKAEGAVIVEHAADKDRTDLELALDHADELGVERIIAIGVEGGRLDHELGNWAALSAKRRAVVEVHTENGTATILHGFGSSEPGSAAVGAARMSLTGEKGDVVSLVAFAGTAAGITTTGLRWPLDSATLEPTSSRGISNEFVDSDASVEILDGTLLVIRPRVCALDG